jgi:NAD(P)-dependent dehydrogenase (short-subunit alcohol dehydrogenase family)
MASLWAIWTQYFPPRNGAPLTEANLPSQAGKVFIVTGGSSGLGYELSRILYGAGGKVYMLTRSQAHADEAIARIQAHYAGRHNDGASTEPGSLHFICMDLNDLATVQSAAAAFLRREPRLDVLFNNAGVAARPSAPPTRQGHEYHLGINSLGGFLLARLLTPVLAATARHQPRGSVRVVWPASLLVDMAAPRDGIRASLLRSADSHAAAREISPTELYSTSKVANWFVAAEFARRGVGGAREGVLHVAGNPGNYVTNIWRDTPGWLYWLLRPILRDQMHGAETYLFMGFSEEVTLEDAAVGRYVICDGRWHPGQREDLVLALRGLAEGGSGRAAEYFDWCVERVKEFV